MTRSGRRVAILLVLLLAVVACVATPPPQRSEPERRAARYLEQGIALYGAGDYSQASDLFSRALHLYQLVDDASGQRRTRINLVETALRAGDVSAARRQLDLLADSDDAGTDHARQLLLSAAVSLAEDDLPRAAAELDQLGGLDAGEQITLSALANRVDIARRSNSGDAPTWIGRYRDALAGSRTQDSLFHARLLRYEAWLSAREGRNESAEEQYARALVLYRARAASSSIAATLEELADLQGTQQDWGGVHDSLQRALTLRATAHEREASLRVIRALEPAWRALGRPTTRLSHWAGVLDSGAVVDWPALRRELERY